MKYVVVVETYLRKDYEVEAENSEMAAEMAFDMATEEFYPQEVEVLDVYEEDE